MLLYYLFWMLMGLFLYFYTIFLPILEFRRKGISNGVQTESNLRERDFLNKHDPEDLEWTSRNDRGGHEAGGAPSTLVAPS